MARCNIFHSRDFQRISQRSLDLADFMLVNADNAVWDLIIIWCTVNKTIRELADRGPSSIEMVNVNVNFWGEFLE